MYSETFPIRHVQERNKTKQTSTSPCCRLSHARHVHVTGIDFTIRDGFILIRCRCYERWRSESRHRRFLEAFTAILHVQSILDSDDAGIGLPPIYCKYSTVARWLCKRCGNACLPQCTYFTDFLRSSRVEAFSITSVKRSFWGDIKLETYLQKKHTEHTITLVCRY